MDYSRRTRTDSTAYVIPIITADTPAHVLAHTTAFGVSEASSDASSRRVLRSLLQQTGSGLEVMQSYKAADGL